MYNFLKNQLLLFKSKKVLGSLSFIESIFFPIPTDVLLIPMAMSKSYKWIDLALIATITSVIGGVVGYYLGVFLFNEIYPYIIEYGYLDELSQSKNLFLEYGVIILFISSFTPLPYKIFVITAGLLSLNANQYGDPILYYLNKYFLWLSFAILLFVLIKL